MKLHLPVLLRKALLACFAFSFACSAAAHAADLTLGGKDSLTIDYAAADSIPDLEGGTLTLNGDAILQLLNCGEGDGKTYTLASGISSLLDAEGNAITLDSTNNAISNYFDATQPGSGFWAGGTLVYAADGTLTLVRHNENVISSSDPNGVTRVTTQQSGGANYQYYKGITFSGIEGAPVTPLSLDGLNRTITPTYSCGAIYGGNDSTITLSNNGSVVFERNYGYSHGGAIRGGSDSTITLSNNGSVVFEGNVTFSHGGTIYGGSDSTITLSNNGSVVFEGNTSYASGSAILGDDSTITLSNNGSVVFERNYCHAFGGVIEGLNSTITLSNNGSVVFEGNTAASTGGAIYFPFERKD